MISPEPPDMHSHLPLTVVYVGDTTRGQALQTIQHEHDWNVLVATEMLQALAMYVFHYPDLIMIDTVPDYDLASSVFEHLRSVNAQPLVVLTDKPNQGPWHAVYSPSVRVMARPTDTAHLIETITDLTIQPTC